MLQEASQSTKGDAIAAELSVDGKGVIVFVSGYVRPVGMPADHCGMQAIRTAVANEDGSCIVLVDRNGMIAIVTRRDGRYQPDAVELERTRCAEDSIPSWLGDVIVFEDDDGLECTLVEVVPGHWSVELR